MSDVIRSINGIFGSDDHYISKYFSSIIEKLDEEIGFDTDYEKIDDNYNEQIVKSNKIDYLLSNLYYIMMCLNFNEYNSFSEINNYFPGLLKEENEKEENLVNNRVSVNTLRKSLKRCYAKNMLSYLLLPDKLFEDAPVSDSEQIEKYLYKNYIYTNSLEELQISSTLAGAQNMYNNDEYTENNFNTFLNKYLENLEMIKDYYINAKESTELTKASIVKELGAASLFFDRYFSEMIFSFNHVVYMSYILEENEENFEKELIIQPGINMKFNELTYLIPDIYRRKYYSNIIFNTIFLSDDSDDDLLLIAGNMLHEIQVYYPILVLAALECIRQLANMETEDKSPAKFFVKQIAKLNKKAVFERDIYEKTKVLNLKRRVVSNSLQYYGCIKKKFLNIKDYKKFGKKITTYNFDMYKLISFYMDNYMDYDL